MKKMNLDDIQDLIKFVAKSGATEVDLEFEGVKISIKSPAKKRRGEKERSKEEIRTIIKQATAQSIEDTPAENSIDAKVLSEEDDSSNYTTIKSEMIGTFYRSPSPEKPSFVNVGDTIKEGDTICIIEAMKLFNEIESEVSGTIVKVLIDDATPIEFGQDLFLINPS